MLNSEQTRWFHAEVKPLEPLLRGYLQKRFPAVADHDDIIQETYARVLSAQTSGRLTFVKGFLFAAARNIAIDLIRAGRKRVHEPISEQLALPALDSVSNVLAAPSSTSSGTMC